MRISTTINFGIVELFSQYFQCTQLISLFYKTLICHDNYTFKICDDKFYDNITVPHVLGYDNMPA